MKKDSLGQRIKELRNERGLSQDELAAILNTTKQTISNYETGFSSPKYDVLLNMAEYFSTTTDYLLGRIPTKNQSTDLRYFLYTKIDEEPPDHIVKTIQDIIDIYKMKKSKV